MFTQAIDDKTKRLLGKIASSGLVKEFYLAGGTALALQLGHRLSLDLDWFRAEKFSITNVKRRLSELGDFEVINEEEGTINGILEGIKVSFLRYDYGMIFPFIVFEKVKLADERDIAAMKIDAVSSRGSKKDFIDIYFLLKKYSLAELIGFFEKKYANIKYNKLHILKSLVFFEDAEDEPMSVMLKEAVWEDIKKKITTETNKIFELKT